MGGTSKQTQDVSQQTSQSPYGPAIPLVTNVAGAANALVPSYSQLNPTQQQAIAGLTANAQSGNPYSTSIGNYATDLLGGGGANAQAPMLQGALGLLQSQLSPYANQTPGQLNQYSQNLFDTLGSDIANRTNAYYAGAGRDLSGANAQNLSRGLAQGLAPSILGQYNQDIQNQMGAANTLYGAANTTGGLLSGLNQTRLANQGTGVDAATAALASRDSALNQLLAIQSAAQGIPLQNLGALGQIGTSIGQLGGTGTKQGTIDQTTTPSAAQQAWGWMGAFGNLGFKPFAPTPTKIGQQAMPGLFDMQPGGIYGLLPPQLAPVRQGMSLLEQLLAQYAGGAPDQAAAAPASGNRLAPIGYTALPPDQPDQPPPSRPADMPPSPSAIPAPLLLATDLTPPNAQSTQDRMPIVDRRAPQTPAAYRQPPQPQYQAPAQGQDFGGNLAAGLSNLAHSPTLGGLADMFAGFTSGQRTDPVGQYQQMTQQTYRALLDAGYPEPQARLAALDPQYQKTLTAPPTFGQVGEDMFGNKQFGFIQPQQLKVTPPQGQAGSPTQAAGYLSPGVSGIDESLAGDAYLKQFSPEIQASVRAYVNGELMPTGNPRKGFTQAVKMIAQRYGSDIGQPADDTSYNARRTMRNQLAMVTPGSVGGQIENLNTAVTHLAALSKRAVDLGNVDIGGPGTSYYINLARGMVSSDQATKLDQLKDAAQHCGQEVTKFYAGSAGGEAERNRFLDAVDGAKTPKQLAGVISTELELIRDRGMALQSGIVTTLGPQGAAKYPVIHKDTERAVGEIQNNVSSLMGTSPSSAARSNLPRVGSPAEAARLPRGTRFVDPDGNVRTVP